MPHERPKVTGTMRLVIRDGKPGVQISDPDGNSLFMDGESASVIDRDGRHLAQLPMKDNRLDVKADVSPEFRASLERIERDQQTAAKGSMFRKMIYAGQIATTGISVDMREGDLAAMARATSMEAPGHSAAPVQPPTPTQSAPATAPAIEALANQFRQEEAERAAWIKSQEERRNSGVPDRSFDQLMDDIGMPPLPKGEGKTGGADRTEGPDHGLKGRTAKQPSDPYAFRA